MHDRIRSLLEEVRQGDRSVESALESLAALPTVDLGHTRVDTQRELRCGAAEVVFAPGKAVLELVEISRSILEHHDRLLVTRVDTEQAAALREAFPAAEHRERSATLTVGLPPAGLGTGLVLVVSAGTADGPVAEEAEVAARFLGARTERLADVGVAGLHRLLAHQELLRAARALVVVAGMEGALPSVVAGLVSRPVVAVPTSVGYGASFAGIAPLLAMLNACAAGVTVVNIDNGFGGGYAAALMNRPPGQVDKGGPDGEGGV